jgi:hypothetical protein
MDRERRITKRVDVRRLILLAKRIKGNLKNRPGTKFALAKEEEKKECG